MTYQEKLLIKTMAALLILLFVFFLWRYFVVSEQIRQENKKLLEEVKVSRIMKQYGCRNEQLRLLISKKAKKYNISPVLAARVIAIESEFNQFAANPDGTCKGYMQVHDVHRLKNPYDPEENIDFGCRYLAEQKQKFATDELVLIAYNGGPGTAIKAIKHHGGQPYLAESKRYVAMYRRLREQSRC